MSGTVLDKLYPLSPPSSTRSPDKKMQVLCLGLSRSGTDSLRNALMVLGYNEVYHGFVITAGQRRDCAFWVPLMRRKFANGHQKLSPLPNFDSVLAPYEAVTDGPANIFGEELIEFYPDAKVVLNRRNDTDAWYRSMRDTCLQVFSWPMWVLSWFDTGIFWLWYNFWFVFQGYYDGDFEGNGRWVAEVHYQKLEACLEKQKREYLDWSVEDGWEPLCEFLGKPVPEELFPSGNKAGGQFEQNMEKATKDLVVNAFKNMTLCIVALFAVGMALWK